MNHAVRETIFCVWGRYKKCWMGIRIHHLAIGQALPHTNSSHSHLHPSHSLNPNKYWPSLNEYFIFWKALVNREQMQYRFRVFQSFFFFNKKGYLCIRRALDFFWLFPSANILTINFYFGRYLKRNISTKFLTLPMKGCIVTFIRIRIMNT